jgi:hypothetical protein
MTFGRLSKLMLEFVFLLSTVSDCYINCSFFKIIIPKDSAISAL